MWIFDFLLVLVVDGIFLYLPYLSIYLSVVGIYQVRQWWTPSRWVWIPLFLYPLLSSSLSLSFSPCLCSLIDPLIGVVPYSTPHSNLVDWLHSLAVLSSDCLSWDYSLLCLSEDPSLTSLLSPSHMEYSTGKWFLSFNHNCICSAEAKASQGQSSKKNLGNQVIRYVEKSFTSHPTILFQ